MNHRKLHEYGRGDGYFSHAFWAVVRFVEERKWLVLTILVGALFLAFPLDVLAQEGGGEIALPEIPGLDQAEKPEDVVPALEILGLITILSVAPAIVMMTTAFTRIVIVLSFIRRAMATQRLPPNQVIVGLALILTFVVMSPTITKIKDQALIPYINQNMNGKVALERTEGYMRRFMFRQTRVKDMELFMNVTNTKVENNESEQATREDVPTMVLVSAFILSELRRAFIMGFALFLPFLIIDLVVASTLISMGMLVLPPILISLPFKLLLFVLVDGWNLVAGSIIKSFHVSY